MKTIFKSIITFSVFGGISAMIFYIESDFEQFDKWELIAVAILGLVIWLFFQWRKMMRLEETTISIQLLDD